MFIQDTVKILNTLLDTVNVLNDLIQTSIDRSKGFAKAAKSATKPEIEALFRQYSTDCAAAVIELQEAVTALGGRPKHFGTVMGMVHRTRLTVKTVVGNSDIIILKEMERAEEHAATVYAEALICDLSPHIRSVLQLQHYGVARNRNLISALHTCYRTTHAIMS